MALQWTIKHKLLGLTVAALLFVAAVSGTGYWGISTVREAAVDVAATGSAIRNHIEAGVYNDLTRANVSAIFTAKGDEQQNKAEEFSHNSKLLKDRIEKARQFTVKTSDRDEESRLVDQYLNAGNALVETILHNPDSAASHLGPYLQLYKELQGKLESTSDQLQKGSDEAQVSATKQAGAATRAMFIICGVSLLLLFVIATRITIGITRPLDAFSARFREMAESNDLSARVDDERNDEIGQLGKYLNLFVEKIGTLLMGVAQISQNVASASTEISSLAGKGAEGAEVEKDQTAQVATAMQEMTATVAQVSEHSNKAADAARQASNTAREGGAIVEDTLAKMRGIAEAVGATARKVGELGKSSDQIGRIVAVINDIADQTNLLALNAAIEAARAGEQGRGFAVVAGEVRKLAERTTTATKEIAQMIRTIQDGTKAAVGAMEQGTRQVEDGVQSTAKAGDSLKQIIQMAEHVGEMITQIATAATQQSSTTEEITRNLDKLSKLVTESALEAQSSATACQDLSALALDLEKMVGSFKLDSTGAAQPEAAQTPELARKWMTAAAGR